MPICLADEDAFLAKIIDDPDNDLNRLVYADWLDENGELNRGCFIRAQCDFTDNNCDVCKNSENRVVLIYAQYDPAGADVGDNGYLEPCPRCGETGKLETDFTEAMPESTYYEYDRMGIDSDDIEGISWKRGFIEFIHFKEQVKFIEVAQKLFTRHPLAIDGEFLPVKIDCRPDYIDSGQDNETAGWPSRSYTFGLREACNWECPKYLYGSKIAPVIFEFLWNMAPEDDRCEFNFEKNAHAPPRWVSFRNEKDAKTAFQKACFAYGLSLRHKNELQTSDAK